MSKTTFTTVRQEVRKTETAAVDGVQMSVETYCLDGKLTEAQAAFTRTPQPAEPASDSDQSAPVVPVYLGSVAWRNGTIEGHGFGMDSPTDAMFARFKAYLSGFQLAEFTDPTAVPR